MAPSGPARVRFLLMHSAIIEGGSIMVKRSILSSVLVALIVASSTVLAMGASVRGGVFGAAPPQAIIPASADLYMDINRGGTQGAALSQLWAAYQSHPGTSAAIARLGAMLGAGTMAQANSLLSSLGDRLGLAVWLPPSLTNSKAQPRVALVAQVKLSSFLGGKGLLTGMDTLVPALTYQGTTVYRLVAKDGSMTGYASVVSGDGVLATDLKTVESVIDAATFHAPSLANSPDFMTATAALPVDRLLTAYISPHFFTVALKSARTSMVSGAAVAALRHPYALAVVAAPDGFSMVTSVQTVPAGTINTTPNAGAGVVGGNAILYASVSGIASMILNSGVLPPNTLSQLQMQTGIMIQRDVLPLISHEVVIDVNDETSPLLVAAAASTAGGAGQSVPTLPGSIELASWVESPLAARHAMAHLASALERLIAQQNKQGQSGTLPPPLKATTLPDGSIAYDITALPTVSFTFRGHWMILSTNLNADIQNAQAPLSADPAYQAALAHVAGAGPLVTVEYLNASRLLKLVDAWLGFAQAHGAVKAADLATWHQVEPLIAPLRNIISVTRQVGANGEQGRVFITIKP